MARKKVVIEVEVPEGLEWLGERALARMARASLERRLFILRRLEELVPEPLATEREVIDIDREIKRRLSKRLES